MNTKTNRVSIIVAVDLMNVIGNSKNADMLPWPNHSRDKKRFAETTKNHVVIMGRVTYESIPQRFRPLKDRIAIVISRTKDFSSEGAVMVRSLKEALEKATELEKNGEIFIAGGEKVYKAALDFEVVDRVYTTIVVGDFGGDAHFPDVLQDYTHWKQVDRVKYDSDEKNPCNLVFITLDKRPI